MGMESHIGNVTGHAKDAKTDYRRYCVGCHGDLGDGNGENFPWIDPKPRDFQLGIFKCRSTPTGTLAHRSGPVRHHRSRPGPLQHAAMEHVHRAAERADLVAWVKHFSPRLATEKPGTPIQIPPEPEVTADRIKAGREVFAQGAVLEVPRRNRRGEWPIRFDPAR